MISYRSFWKLLIDKNLKRKDVLEQTKISGMTLTKMSKNKYVSLEVINRLCAFLNCQPGDLIEYIPDKEAKK